MKLHVNGLLISLFNGFLLNVQISGQQLKFDSTKELYSMTFFSYSRFGAILK